MEQDSFDQYCSIKGITRSTKAKQVLGTVHRVITGKIVELSFWDTNSIMLLNSTRKLICDVAVDLIHHPFNLSHYTLSLDPIGSNQLDDPNRYIIYEGVLGSDSGIPLAKGIQTLISATNAFNGNGGSRIFKPTSPLYIYIQHPLRQICNV